METLRENVHTSPGTLHVHCVSQFSGVTLIFEHSPSQMSEIEHFEIFSNPQENQLTQ